ncbi:MAG: hypothetical protein M3355_11925 [Actinomycetota bacterium]|nr:hypothetical protein [Actinomycetota bacterium]
MADRISTYRNVASHLIDARTATLMACERCAFVWDEPTKSGSMDMVVIACPCCTSVGAEPLYDMSGESTNRDWGKCVFATRRGSEPHKKGGPVARTPY